MTDTINPDHYKTHQSGIECIEITEHMNFCIGNAIKYLWRSGLKGNAVDDLQKAAWYIDREIARLKKAEVDQMELCRPAEISQALKTPDCIHAMSEYIDNEKYSVTFEEDEAFASLKSENWNAPDFGPALCTHSRWHYYQSTHTKTCQKCGHEEAWHGG